MGIKPGTISTETFSTSFFISDGGDCLSGVVDTPGPAYIPIYGRPIGYTQI